VSVAADIVPVAAALAKHLACRTHVPQYHIHTKLSDVRDQIESEVAILEALVLSVGGVSVLVTEALVLSVSGVSVLTISLSLCTQLVAAEMSESKAAASA
jgi:hypothetical protein